MDKKLLSDLCELGKITVDEKEEDRLCDELEAFLELISKVKGAKDEEIRTLISAIPDGKPAERSGRMICTQGLNALIGGRLSNDPDAVAVKDNILIKGVRTTCASRMLKDFIAPYDAVAVGKLREKGFSFYGKTNMDEFAMGSYSDTGIFGPVRNPYDTQRSAGGSSGGSAAVVASGECRWALGSDTGGSVRLPAAMCGITGLKPTYGNVSRHGLVAFASSLDQIGMMARTGEDVLKLFEAVSEKRFISSSSDNLRILIPEDMLGLSSYAEYILEVPRALGASGAEFFKMPYLDLLAPCYYAISCAEASSNLGRYYGQRYPSREEGFGSEVKKRILTGNLVLSSGFYDEYYMRSSDIARKLGQALEKEMTPGTFVLMPVSSGSAVRLDKRKDPVNTYMDDVYNVAANLTGLPSIAFPLGFDREGLPVGVQLMGIKGSEKDLCILADRIIRGMRI